MPKAQKRGSSTSIKDHTIDNEADELHSSHPFFYFPIFFVLQLLVYEYVSKKTAGYRDSKAERNAG